MTASTIRLARPEDTGALVSLAAGAHAVSQYSSIEFIPTKATQFFYRCINSALCCVFVAEKDGAIVGVIVGLVGQLWDGALDGRYTTDLLFFVDEEHRGSGAALAQAYINWARQQSRVRDIQLGTTFGGDTSRAESLFEALGGKRVGAYFSFGGAE